MDGGRTDELLADGRTDGFQKTFSALFKSYPRFVPPKKIKRGYSPKNDFHPFLSHIRVLSKRIKREYGPKNVFQPSLSHIRVLSERQPRPQGLCAEKALASAAVFLSPIGQSLIRK
jgi:hypothetical protein